MPETSGDPDLLVDNLALERSSRLIAGTVEEFEQVTKDAVDALSELRALIDNPVLARAISRFAATSILGERRIDAGMRDLSAVVAEAACTYEATDQAIAKGLQA